MSTSDSPWFWLSLFLCGGLIALTLAEPKFRARQAQLDRQFQARQNAGQTVATTNIQDDGEALITLRPLFGILTTAVCLATLLFWATRPRRVAREHTHPDSS